MSPSNVVVWCRCSRHRTWFAFEPHISNTIEEHYLSGSKSVIDISPISLRFFSCEIDLQTKVLRCNDDGTEEPIDRRVYVKESVFARCIAWEFEADYEPWESYDVESTHLIEEAFSMKRRNKKLDLRERTGKPYIIDFENHTQRNVRTGKIRKIRWTQLSEEYAVDKLGSAVSVSVSPKKDGAYSRTRNAKKFTPCYEDMGTMRTQRLTCSQERPRVVPEPSHTHTESLPLQTHVKLGKFKCSNARGGSDQLSPFVLPAKAADQGEEEDCLICFDKLSEACSFGDAQTEMGGIAMLNKCGHVFHQQCLLELLKHSKQDVFLQCPKCKCVHGEKIGNCPAGTMHWKKWGHQSLAGHEGWDTIVITYEIPHGRQVEGHPCPGRPFAATGFPRIAYLPDTDKGRKVLKLLMEAFRRRLMFTIGTSITTGLDNTVTWNDIHVKTEAFSNRGGHGFPDPNYLDNVMKELASNGVTEDCLQEKEVYQGAGVKKPCLQEREVCQGAGVKKPCLQEREVYQGAGVKEPCLQEREVYQGAGVKKPCLQEREVYQGAGGKEPFLQEREVCQGAGVKEPCLQERELCQGVGVKEGGMCQGAEMMESCQQERQVSQGAGAKEPYLQEREVCQGAGVKERGVCQGAEMMESCLQESGRVKKQV